mmetsp:Transcript_17570/g.41413  ORF Transcript_17570/g.41413 Transcript_17570/m.41413 type:complete len:144 (+) Transcript_17570:26-457(+)
MASSGTRRVADEVLELFKKFKLSNASNAAMLLKIDKDDETVVLDEHFADTTPEDLVEEMSESSPRYIVYSFRMERDGGRIQYPLILIMFMPKSAPDRARMLYASMSNTVGEALDIAKTYELRDLDDFDGEWLKAQVNSTSTRK